MKPNVLLILTDDQRYNTIHALGSPQIHTPNMDWIVENGVSFTHAHIPGGTSGAVCMPSRAMLHTGRSLFRLEDMGQDIPLSHTTLGEKLKTSGYHCFGTGKWHNGPPAFTRSFHEGNNIFFGGMWDHWNVPTCNYDPTGEYDNVINFVSNFHLNSKPFEVHCDKFNPGKHSSELLTDTTVEFLKQYDGDQPFFAYTAYLAPHDPRTMPKKYMEMYNPEEIDLPENFLTEHPFEFGVSGIRDELLAKAPREEAEVKRHLAEYYGMISHLDNEIGRILDTLRETGELENTIIVLAGDNGLALGSHGLMGKQSLYEHSVRVPLLFCGPGIPKNERRSQFVYLYDIFPTLCELLGEEIPESVDGKSFAGMFTDETAVTREGLYLAYCEILRGYKDDRYKLIQYRNNIEKTQLFDLKNDPYEKNDLAESPAHQQILATLQAEMEKQPAIWDEMASRFGQEYWNRKQ